MRFSGFRFVVVLTARPFRHLRASSGDEFLERARETASVKKEKKHIDQ
jgi:hypothetical protein